MKITRLREIKSYIQKVLDVPEGKYEIHNYKYIGECIDEELFPHDAYSDLLLSLYEEFDIDISKKDCEAIAEEIPDFIIDLFIKVAIKSIFSDNYKNRKEKSLEYWFIKFMLLIFRCYVKQGNEDDKIGHIILHSPVMKVFFTSTSVEDNVKVARLIKICDLLRKFEGLSSIRRESMICVLTGAFLDRKGEAYTNITNLLNELDPKDIEKETNLLNESTSKNIEEEPNKYEEYMRLYHIYNDAGREPDEELKAYLYRMGFNLTPQIPYKDFWHLLGGYDHKRQNNDGSICLLSVGQIKEIKSKKGLDGIQDIFPYYPLNENDDTFPIAMEEMHPEDAEKILSPEQFAACKANSDKSGMCTVLYFAVNDKYEVYTCKDWAKHIPLKKIRQREF